jgi:hypothetical protein
MTLLRLILGADGLKNSCLLLHYLLSRATCSLLIFYGDFDRLLCIFIHEMSQRFRTRTTEMPTIPFGPCRVLKPEIVTLLRLAGISVRSIPFFLFQRQNLKIISITGGHQTRYGSLINNNLN